MIAWFWDLVDPIFEARYIRLWFYGLCVVIGVFVFLSDALAWVKRKIKVRPQSPPRTKRKEGL